MSTTDEPQILLIQTAAGRFAADLDVGEETTTEYCWRVLNEEHPRPTWLGVWISGDHRPGALRHEFQHSRGEHHETMVSFNPAHIVSVELI